jgi:hypothetical protein
MPSTTLLQFLHPRTSPATAAEAMRYNIRVATVFILSSRAKLKWGSKGKGKAVPVI